ncbi:hypothetical protein IU433_07920 [Nocardia puris]|nr:hypothetical protein [Nocardia puris]MBF6211462.1 hypothetical protein [Nocardia puris]MBF6365179.1 hypothetical protein [Nocardia puris]MBF6458965.1 hypothetical protein [Nocardia puris]
MRISRITATALLALATTGLASGVAPADPAADPALDLRGAFHEIDYHVSVAEDRRATVTTLTDGRFDLVSDNRVVTVADRDGEVVAALPMTLHIAGQRVDLVPDLDESGTRLTLAPAEMAETPVREINAQQRFFAEAEKAMPQILAGAAIGAGIGFLVGFPLGLFVFDFITVPITTVVGGVIGAFAGLYHGGGQPAIDAAEDYLTGQP